MRIVQKRSVSRVNIEIRSKKLPIGSIRHLMAIIQAMNVKILLNYSYRTL